MDKDDIDEAAYPNNPDRILFNTCKVQDIVEIFQTIEYHYPNSSHDELFDLVFDELKKLKDKCELGNENEMLRAFTKFNTHKFFYHHKQGL